MRATKILQQRMSSLLGFIHAARLAAVFWAVRSLMVGGRLSLTAIGRFGAIHSMPKHAIKRADRLLGNKKLHAELPAFFRCQAELVIGSKRRPVVLIDWTRIEPKHVALVAAVPLDGRSLPIYVEVHPERLDNNPNVLKRFLQNLADVLPPKCAPVIVTDAGFRTSWFSEVVRNGWDFVGRVRHNSLTRDLVHSEWVTVKELYKKATTRAKDLGHRILPQSNPRCMRFVLVKKRTRETRTDYKTSSVKKKAISRAWHPWLLATSLDNLSAKRVVDIYAKRMQIEETFRDAKNYRFGWSFGHARSNSSKRLEVLMLIASLGMLAVTLIGNAAERRGLHCQYQANTIRNRRVLSLFYLGCSLIGRAEELPIKLRELQLSLRDLRKKQICLEPEIRSYFVGIP